MLVRNGDDPLRGLARATTARTLTFGIDDAGSAPAGDAARERLEVVPGLRHAAALRARVPRPSGRLELPQLRPAAAPRSTCGPTRVEPQGLDGTPVRAAHAARRRRRRAARARPLQRLQRARRGRGRVRRRRRRRRPDAQRAWSGSTPPSGGSSGCASAIATPCCCWPRTRPARTRSSARSPPTSRPKQLLVALNDRIADGRDVSWIWDVDFELLAGHVQERRHRRHAGGRDGDAAEVRRRRARRRLVVAASIAAGARPGARGRRGAGVPARHLHGDARAARGARRGAASSAPTGRRRDRPARLPPLPRAPEHLRRPRQHRRSARRAASGAGSGSRRPAAAPATRCPTPTSTTSAAARIATSCWSPTTSSAGPAICARRSTRAHGCSRCAAATSCSGTTTAATTGDEMRGTGLVDLETEAGDDAHDRQHRDRLRASRRASRMTVVGFENHAGRTRLGEGVRPLGRVLHGHGNNGGDGGEGVPRRPHRRHLHPRAAAAQEPGAGRPC